MVSNETSNDIEVSGTAQTPKTLPWATNRQGARSEQEAAELARRWGVIVPEDVYFIFRDDLVTVGAYAQYGGFQSYRSVRWSDFYVQGRIPVKVRRSVLDSDEAIVAVIAHEMFELNALREMFEERDTIPGTEIIALIRPEQPHNLHDRAWDAADELVWAMRKEGEC